ncbi:MAG: hypothetical protein ISR27_02135 [Pseudomonadales bacterium]|nr:hypothetical protein [Pseudomonadales bacterium]
MNKLHASRLLWQGAFLLFFLMPVFNYGFHAQTEQAPHGDHIPDHNGLVLMHSNEDMHFEVVVIEAGGIELYLSNAIRLPLPAVTVSDVVVEIERTDGSIEFVTMAMSASGDAWVGSSKPVQNKDSIVRIGFLFEGEPFFIDIPAMAFPPIREMLNMPMVMPEEQHAA